MGKSKLFMAGVLIIVLIFEMTVVGCSTSKHSIEINNVHNIREIYIKNTGTSNWGANLAGTLWDIHKSNYSERVDIRVIDTNGIVYSKNNVPFGDADFVEVNKYQQINIYAFAGVLGAVGLIGAIAARGQ